MFVQKLTKDDILLISKMILESVKTNKAEIKNYFKFSRISFNSYCVSFDFCDENSEENWIHFFDYEIKSNFVYTQKDLNELTLIYKKFMYRKFGMKYLEEMKGATEDKYIKEAERVISVINKEIEDIIK